MISPDITWFPQLWSIAMIILFIISDLKFKSRAITGCIACYHAILKASIITTLTPFSWNVLHVCFRGTQSVHARSCVCLKAEFLFHTVLANQTAVFNTTRVYSCLNRLIFTVFPQMKLDFVQAVVPWWSQWRGTQPVCEFQMWNLRCRQFDSWWFHETGFCGIWSTIM